MDNLELLEHIKRKTVDYLEIPEEKFENLKDIFPPLSNNEKFVPIKYKDIPQNYVPYLIWNSGLFARGFLYNNNGMACIIPMADPVLIYFNLAQMNLKQIYSLKKELLEEFGNKTSVKENSLNIFYVFFGIASAFIIMLVTSLEAFVNSKIDKNFSYKKKDGEKCVKVYNCEQIQRWILFEEKVTSILNKETNKNFAKKHKSSQEKINQLIKLRNEVIHTKTDNTHKYYENLYTDMLRFKFNETIMAVRDFINFYEENLIEQCPCGANN